MYIYECILHPISLYLNMHTPTHTHLHTSTNYLLDCGVNIVMAKTGVKYVHHKALQFDIGVCVHTYICKYE